MRDLSSHLDRLLRDEHWGEAITVTSPQGTATPISTAGWTSGRIEHARQDGETVQFRTATATVRVADLAHAERGYTVTRDATGETWAVHYTDHGIGSSWVLHLRRAVATDHTAGHYRR